jgi:hypothetical protein
MSLQRFTMSRRRKLCHLRAILHLMVALLSVVLAINAAKDDDITPQRTFGGHPFEVYSVAFSPIGKTLASGGADLSSRLKPGEIMLWDVRRAGSGTPSRGMSEASGQWRSRQAARLWHPAVLTRL